MRVESSLTVEQINEMLEHAGIESMCVLNEGNGRLRFETGPGGGDGEEAVIASLQSFFTTENGFAEHEVIFIGRDPEYDTIFFASVHSTVRGLAQGGLRLSKYLTVGDAIRDGLRLSQGMTRKNALAELWWGGGKGVIPLTTRLEQRLKADSTGRKGVRKSLFQAYGRFVSSLRGIYYTAADLNTSLADMENVLSTTRFVTCLPVDHGGSGDPSPMTARGVHTAMSTAWKELFGAELSGVRVAVQGVGKVGKPLAHGLAKAGALLTLADYDRRVAEGVAQDLQSAHPGLHVDVVERDEILRAPVDVVAPCAKGGVIGEAAVAALHEDVKLVCGGANNILDDEDRDAALLHARGITFIPDFLCNRMGIINCADEWLGYSEDEVEKRIPAISADTRELLSRTRQSGRNTLQEARAMADERLTAEEHPLKRMQGRGQLLAKAFADRLQKMRAFHQTDVLEHRTEEPETYRRW